MADNDELPEVPKLTVTLPPHPDDTAEGGNDGARLMAKSAIASQAAGALVTPILVGTFLGVWLDKKFNTSWITISSGHCRICRGRRRDYCRYLKKLAD